SWRRHCRPDSRRPRIGQNLPRASIDAIWTSGMTEHELIANEASAARKAGDEGASRQYLSFFLGGQEYATDILRVQEIKGWDTVTRVPYSPNYILGVINLRGAIVPVVDLRVRLALESASFDSATVVIVVRVA